MPESWTAARRQMHASPSGAVTEARGSVHGLEGLTVADASIMPTLLTGTACLNVRIDYPRSFRRPTGPSGRKQKRDTRQRPTLPPRCQGSTIGAGGLNCCVRDGNRCFPTAMITGYLSHDE